MRNVLLALGLAFALESAAQACSCLGPQDVQQKREWARNMLKVAIAVVEVERIADPDSEAASGERYRVVRRYVGKAPATFSVDGSGPETTCDDVLQPGERKIVFLYDPRPYRQGIGGAALRKRAADSPPSNYLFGGMCQRLFIDQAGNLQLILEEARKLGITAR